MAELNGRPKPYRVGTPRDGNGQFAPRTPQERQMPDNPLADEANGGRAEKWAPGIGMNSRPTFGQRNPWPPIDPKKSVPGGTAMKNLRSGK